MTFYEWIANINFLTNQIISTLRTSNKKNKKIYSLSVKLKFKR